MENIIETIISIPWAILMFISPIYIIVDIVMKYKDRKIFYDLYEKTKK